MKHKINLIISNDTSSEPIPVELELEVEEGLVIESELELVKNLVSEKGGFDYFNDLFEDPESEIVNTDTSNKLSELVDMELLNSISELNLSNNTFIFEHNMSENNIGVLIPVKEDLFAFDLNVYMMQRDGMAQKIIDDEFLSHVDPLIIKGKMAIDLSGILHMNDEQPHINAVMIDKETYDNFLISVKSELKGIFFNLEESGLSLNDYINENNLTEQFKKIKSDISDDCIKFTLNGNTFVLDSASEELADIDNIYSLKIKVNDSFYNVNFDRDTTIDFGNENEQAYIVEESVGESLSEQINTPRAKNTLRSKNKIKMV